MSAAEIVMLAYVLGATALIVIAIAFALWFSGLSHRPASRLSADCLSGLHEACQASGACTACRCHEKERVA